ncbi:helix-turn-helix domain-containing protein [Amycolatopsis benzoatilytica]|uniref:helix-turn-helix domain-containing protein n=1 Tax=Amycolatopsis benzoatilytica TaxID=346045 RepID=UPI0003621561|nr:helix-turn-helix transcriptional regulator [Amycolatopsis benzoatilytica]
MKWDLRMAAARREIWKASDMRRLLADHGLEISVGKMSNLWSGQPTSIRLDDLDVICAVLGCGPEELLLREPGKVAAPPAAEDTPTAAVAGERPAVQPLRRSGRTAPP